MLDIDTLADQLELERTVWTLGRCLDERDFDGLRQLFTCDATVTTGKGRAATTPWSNRPGAATRATTASSTLSAT